MGEGSLRYAYDGTLATSETLEGSVGGMVSWSYDNDLALQRETVRCTTATNTACQPVVFGYDQDKLLTAAGALTLLRNAQNGLLTGTTLGTDRLVELQRLRRAGELPRRQSRSASVQAGVHAG